MHCVEIQATDINRFRQEVGKYGAEVKIISKYQDKGVKFLDIEVSKDSKAISILERVFSCV